MFFVNSFKVVVKGLWQVTGVKVINKNCIMIINKVIKLNNLFIRMSKFWAEAGGS